MTAWIFQGNPDTFDVERYVATATEVRWLVRQHGTQIKVGDTVYIWQALGKERRDSGVLAVCTVTAAPAVMPDDEASRPFWSNPMDANAPELRAMLRVVERASPKYVIKRDWLKEDPICHDLPVFIRPQGTNYPLNEDHANRLARLWSRTGLIFDRYELLACLRAYSQVWDKAVSKAPGSPVAQTAVRIGRAVSSVYAKLMNFRSLDPRHAGAGQTHGGEGDEDVWNNFWRDDSLDIARLDAELAAMETPGASVELQRELEVSAGEISKTYSAEGRRKLVMHFRIERDRRVVDDAKAAWYNADPRMPCCVCGMSFREVYGDVGRAFIEAHHREPLSSLEAARIPSVEDLAPVCANCHRMLHRDATLTVDGLRALLHRS